MKKSLFFATAMILLTGVLAGCGGSQNELDFKSVRDTETGEIFSLGDTKEKIDGILGEGEYNENEYMENHVYYKYMDGLVSIYYDDEDQANSITVHEYTKRFVFSDVNFDMKERDLGKDFTKVEMENDYVEHYLRYYDGNGSAVETRELGEYGLIFHVSAKDSYIGWEGDIVSINIARLAED